MNSNSEIDQIEKKKLQKTKESLQNIHDTNMITVNTLKGKLETLNENMGIATNYRQYLEKKIKGLLTEINNIKWNQIKATTVLRSDREFIEQYINNNSPVQNGEKIDFTDEDALMRKVQELKHVSNICQTECTMLRQTINELQNKYEKMG